MLPKATKRREKLRKTNFYLDLNKAFLQKAAFDILSDAHSHLHTHPAQKCYFISSASAFSQSVTETQAQRCQDAGFGH